MAHSRPFAERGVQMQIAGEICAMKGSVNGDAGSWRLVGADLLGAYSPGEGHTVPVTTLTKNISLLIAPGS